MPESTTEEPSTTTKPKSSAYLICEGAECMCLLGSTLAKLKVTSHKKAYINDNKLVATEKDITFEDKYFGTCSAKAPSSNACVPDVQQWLMSYKDIEVENHKVLTDKSMLKCKAGGLITITKHGQTQEVTAEQAENMDRTIALQVNALADISFVKIPEKTVKVKSITGTIVEEEKFELLTKTEPIKSEMKTKPKNIFVRPGQAVEFTAEYEGTAALVCWRFKENTMNKYFLQHGSVYEAHFPAIGKYTIEGYGTGGDTNFDVETQLNSKGVEIPRVEDVSCSLDILVQENKLIKISHNTSGSITDNTQNDKTTEVHIRLGVPAIFEAEFALPPTKSEVEHLMLVLKDAGGNELKRTKGKLKMVFEAKNSAADYSLEASFDNSDDKPIVCPIKTSLNTVSIVAATGAGDKEYDKVRPGTPIIFNVAKTKFTDDTIALELIESEESLIKWYENSEICVATGPTYSKVYQDEGAYTVRCNVSERKPGWFSMNTDTLDDWHFVVTRNYPTVIEQKSAGLVKVGKLATFEMKSIFMTDVFERKTIQWKLSGPQTDSDEGKTFYSFIPRAKGQYIVSATLNGKTKEKKIECIECEITDAWWTDADGNMLTGSDAESNPSNTIGFAGWGQEVAAAFNHIGLNGEKVRLEIWHVHDSTHMHLHTTHTTVPDTNNSFYYSFHITDTMKGKIQEELWNLNNNGNLYFKLVSESGLKIRNNGAALPFMTEKYLKVDSRVRVRAYFADNNDTKRYSTVDLNTPVFLQVKSTNLIGTELDVQFYRSIKNDENEEDLEYKSTGKKHTFKVDTDGMKSIKIDLNVFKDLLQKPTDSLTIYATISTTSDADVKYSTQNKYMLKLYKALATNPVSIGTAKAFVTVDLSEGEKNEYKVCECEARVRAFMRMLRVGEGTVGEKGYTTLFGNEQFTDFSNHPQKIIKQGGYSSSAAGAYQIMGYTYKWLNGIKLNSDNKDSGIYEEYHDYIKKYSINDFSAANQDKLCVVILKHKRKGCIELIIKGEIQKALEDYASYEWASLPPGRYGQPTQTLEKAQQKFEEYLKFEKNESSDLKIKKDFLAEFGYSCKCERELINRKPSVWVNPLDYCERTYFNSLGIHKEQNGAFGPVRLNTDGSAKNHQGLDLFAIPGTIAKACLDGEIVSYSNEGDDGYGNVLVLKVSGADLRKAKNNYVLEFSSVEKDQGDGFDINANEFYIRYAHLKSAAKTSGRVKAGDIICYTGETGNANGVPNPHLHFEIAMKKSGNGKGLTYRYNPAFFVKLSAIKVANQTEEQNKRKK